MELKEFIRNTLTQIAEGVQEAIDDSKGKGYLINASMGEGTTHMIHFDLAVTSEKEGGANIKVLSGTVAEKSVSRISFEIGMQYPTSKHEKKHGERPFPHGGI